MLENELRVRKNVLHWTDSLRAAVLLLRRADYPPPVWRGPLAVRSTSGKDEIEGRKYKDPQCHNQQIVLYDAGLYQPKGPRATLDEYRHTIDRAIHDQSIEDTGPVRVESCERGAGVHQPIDHALIYCPEGRRRPHHRPDDKRLIKFVDVVLVEQYLIRQGILLR